MHLRVCIKNDEAWMWVMMEQVEVTSFVQGVPASGYLWQSTSSTLVVHDRIRLICSRERPLDGAESADRLCRCIQPIDASVRISGLLQ